MKKELFDDLVTSIREMVAIKKGKINPGRVTGLAAADAKDIREGLHLSQAEFAAMLGVSKATLQNWEQGRRNPVGPAKALLTVAQRHPREVMDALLVDELSPGRPQVQCPR